MGIVGQLVSVLLMATRYSTDQLIAMIRGAAARYGINAEVAIKQLRQESANFAPSVVYGPKKSSAGAMGLAQFMPATAKRFGLADPFDPVQALEAWGKYMRLMLQMFNGRIDIALAGYNSGENRQEYKNAAAQGRAINWSVLPSGVQSQTKQYVAIILGSSSLPSTVPVLPSSSSAPPVPGLAPGASPASGAGGEGDTSSGGSETSWGPLVVGVLAVSLLATLLDT